MFDYDSFYSDLRCVDTKNIPNSFYSNNVDFISIDKQIARAWRKLHSAECKDFFAYYNSFVSCYEYYFKNYPFELKIARKLNNNRFHRNTRLKKRIQFMLDNFDCLFLTFTFDNESLSNLSALTRRRYITRALRTLNCYAVANIDFGKKNNREHFHAVVSVGNIDNSSKSFWSYGALNFKKILYNLDNSSALSTYVSKLSNHAIKDTTDSYNFSTIYIKPKKYKKSLQK